jgi:hypothetical protein
MNTINYNQLVANIQYKEQNKQKNYGTPQYRDQVNPMINTKCTGLTQTRK